MTYHPLTADTGQSPERRREEASELVQKITSAPGWFNCELSDKEIGFIEQMEDESLPVSAKQILWLRDIWEKL